MSLIDHIPKKAARNGTSLDLKPVIGPEAHKTCPIVKNFTRFFLGDGALWRTITFF